MTRFPDCWNLTSFPKCKWCCVSSESQGLRLRNKLGVCPGESHVAEATHLTAEEMCALIRKVEIVKENSKMKMKKLSATLVILLCLSFGSLKAKAQSDELPKFEVGVHFTSITKPSFGNGDTEPGLGGRLTYNINRSIAVEAVGNFFPHSCRSCGGAFGDNSGNITQGFVGVKAGKRFEKWGIFAKARPGITSFSKGEGGYVSNGSASFFPFEFRQKRANHFAADLGAVLEFYTTRRLVTRFEGGDTLIHYGSRQTNVPGIDGAGNFTLVPLPTRSETRHNFQFSAGIGWRF